MICICEGSGMYSLSDDDEIICDRCKGLYRPSHIDHTGGGTYEECDYCLNWRERKALEDHIANL